MKSFAEGALRGAILAVVVLAIIYLWGCGAAPYAECSPERTFRCNGDVVESCNGDFWNPIMECQNECEQDGTDADCVDVDGGEVEGGE